MVYPRSRFLIRVQGHSVRVDSLLVRVQKEISAHQNGPYIKYLECRPLRFERGRNGFERGSNILNVDGLALNVDQNLERIHKWLNPDGPLPSAF